MDEPTPPNAFRASDEPFTLRNEDRFCHIYVSGKTGVGKSTLLFNTAVQDIEDGFGVAFIDLWVKPQLLAHVGHGRLIRMRFGGRWCTPHIDHADLVRVLSAVSALFAIPTQMAS